VPPAADPLTTTSAPMIAHQYRRNECFCHRATLDELLADDVMEPVLRTAGYGRDEFRNMLTEMALTWSRLDGCNSKGSP
jgi:hypothetical protein